MFNKGKSRRRLFVFRPAEAHGSSFDGLAELTRVIASSEPARFELLNQPDAEDLSPPDEPQSLAHAEHERTVSHASTDEKVFHFGCFPSTTTFYLEKKPATAAVPHQEASYQRIER
jgi:hypothetical protein